jgi:hypothetical protein
VLKCRTSRAGPMFRCGCTDDRHAVNPAAARSAVADGAESVTVGRLSNMPKHTGAVVFSASLHPSPVMETA